jgi:NAD(P)-dependent dehydrogenase (short-subunit alcohol dehydrogenase family)
VAFAKSGVLLLHCLQLVPWSSSGIGRAATLMMAREGANVTIVHLPQEITDARDVKKQIEDESNGKQKCLTLPLDLVDDENCKKAVDGTCQLYMEVSIFLSHGESHIRTKNRAREIPREGGRPGQQLGSPGAL